MLGHIGLNVGDLESARAHYGALLPTLGFERFRDDPDQFAYRPADGKRGTFLFFYPALEPGAYSPDRAGLQHLAFMVPSRQEVRDAYALALTLGSTELHAPQAFPQYPPPYFAAFWRDPFGFTVEVVCHHDR